MIIIFGLRRLKKAMGPVLLRCSNCGMSPLALLRVSTWFALFFIPMIPVSFKHYTVCPNCKRLDQVSRADVDRARAQEDALRSGSNDGTAGISVQPATLEHAVQEWASVGHASTAPSADSPSTAPTDPISPPSPPPLPPAGWYADPVGVGSQRFWDGQQWTEQTTPTV
jgi:hypothetical protein